MTYAFDYQPTFIEWFVNGVSVKKIMSSFKGNKGTSLPSHAGKMMLNLWAGDSTWTLPFVYEGPLEMKVDWVRYDP